MSDTPLASWLSNRPRPIRAPGKAAKRWAIFLAVVTVVWTAAMLASLHWRFLDRFIVSSDSGRIGWDFFLAPRAVRNLSAGNNIFLTELSDYGPYATSFVQHPFLAVAAGSWTAPLSPWAAFGAFGCVSVGLLLLGAWLLASVFDDPASKAFSYFAMLCSLPVYAMLWAGQMNVFVVLAVALVFAGLMRLEQEPEGADRHLRWVQLGLLISLLSKPVVALMLPVLFVLPETRRKLLLPAAIYAVVSLLFLLVPRLNPGGYNGIHWLYIPNASFKTKVTMTLVNPAETDLSACHAIYCLPMLLNAGGAGKIVLLLAKLPVVAVALMSLAPLILPKRGQRIRAAIVTAALCVLSYNLSYFQGWEYHYTTLLPLLPAILWLRQHESVPQLRGLLTGAFLASLLLFVPTPFFLAPEDPNFWALSALLRVMPVMAAFYCLAIYGAAPLGRARRRPRLVALPTVRGLRGALCLGGVIGLLFGSVAATVYATVPARLLVAAKNWTPQDWKTHLEDLISRPGIAADVLAVIHEELGQLYVPTEPRIALEHYRKAAALEPHSEEFCTDLGNAFFGLRHFEEAVDQYEKALAFETGSAEAHNNLGAALAGCGRIGEAMAHFQRALEIKPDHAEAHINLAAALAGCGRIGEAMAHFQRALEIEPDHAEAHNNLGFALAGRGRIDEAIEHYQKALEIKPDYAEAHVNLGVALAGGGRIDEAIAHFRRALEIKPGYAEAHIDLGTALANQRRMDEAMAHFQKALEIKPDCAEAHINLGIALAGGGRIDEAIDHYQRALVLATQQNKTALAEELKARLRTYEAGTPHRQPQRPSEH
jgi:tetratricopeptide (TPR) repeat protein